LQARFHKKNSRVTILEHCQ